MSSRIQAAAFHRLPESQIPADARWQTVHPEARAGKSHEWCKSPPDQNDRVRVRAATAPAGIAARRRVLGVFAVRDGVRQIMDARANPFAQLGGRRSGKGDDQNASDIEFFFK